MKRVLLTVAAAVLLAGPLSTGVSAAGGGNNVVTKTSRVNPNALREMLTKGLKATNDDERLYIEYVVQLVAFERLPVSYVYASFKYARKRRPDYPFPYFQHSLRALSRKLDVDL